MDKNKWNDPSQSLVFDASTHNSGREKPGTWQY